MPLKSEGVTSVILEKAFHICVLVSGTSKSPYVCVLFLSSFLSFFHAILCLQIIDRACSVKKLGVCLLGLDTILNNFLYLFVKYKREQRATDYLF
ncbi:hypothetical protein LguiA_027824 [Lonicera macranthoides]